MLEAATSPARPAQRPENTYTRNFTVPAWTPAYVLAVWLSPTDSMKRPIAVLRVRNTVTASRPTLSNTGNGNPNKLPLPMYVRRSSVNVMIWPSVMSWATPRPATIRTKVATMGWTLRTPTSNPFQQPAASETTSADPITIGNGTPARLINCAATAPAIAITAPTERSTPPVAMTRAMPRASSMTFEPWLRISINTP